MRSKVKTKRNKSEGTEGNFRVHAHSAHLGMAQDLKFLNAYVANGGWVTRSQEAGTANPNQGW